MESCVSIRINGEIKFFPDYAALVAWQNAQPVTKPNAAAETLAKSYGYGQGRYCGD